MVGDGDQSIALASHHGKFAINGCFLLGMLMYIFFDVVSGQSRWIQCASRRSRVGSEKRFHSVDEIVAAAIDLQKMAQLHVSRIRASCEREIKLQTFRVALAPINLFNIVRGVY